jgi:regulator of vacuolar morphogenesis
MNYGTINPMANNTWHQKFDSANALLLSIKNAINSSASDVEVASKSMEIRKAFAKFDQELSDLHNALATMGGTAGENARRKGKLSKLQQERALLQESFKARTGITIEKWKNTGKSAKGKGPAEESLETLGMENQQILEHQRNVLDQQDEDADQLYLATQRIKNVGLMIRDELTEQDKLLDTLGAEEDIAIGKLSKEKGRLGKLVELNKNNISFCCVLLLIVGLFVLIFFLLGVL